MVKYANKEWREEDRVGGGKQSRIDKKHYQAIQGVYYFICKCLNIEISGSDFSVSKGSHVQSYWSVQ